MKLRFDIWGVLPAFYGKSPDALGHTKGIFVRLPDGYTPVMLAHEQFHVKQVYAWIASFIAPASLIYGSTLLGPVALALAAAFIGALLWLRLAPKNRLKREITAYAESVRTAIKHDPNLDRQALINYYATVLDTHPAYAYQDEDFNSIRSKIEDKIVSKELF